MNFYKHHIGDYIKKTGHLTLAEHGAYSLMLQMYYATEAPLPVGKALYRLLRAETKAEIRAIESVAEAYWQKSERGLTNSRADEEIARAAHQREVNQQLGKLGGRPRKTESVSESVSESKPNRNPIQTPDSTIQTKNKSLERAQRASPRATRLPTDWVLTPERESYARKESLDPARTFAKFTDYWRAASGRTAAKLDWDAAWRNWCRTEADRGNTKQTGVLVTSDPASRAWADLIASDGAKRDAKVQAALDACGGWLAIKGRNSFTEAKLRAEFCDAYRRAA